jgi:hypothetical protein
MRVAEVYRKVARDEVFRVFALTPALSFCAHAARDGFGGVLCAQSMKREHGTATSPKPWLPPQL